MKNLSYILVFILFISCEKSIDVENFNDFKKSLDTITSKSTKSFNITQPSLYEKTEDYFGKLSQNKIKKILLSEIETLNLNNDIKVSSSSMAILKDTTLFPIRKCGSYDTADSTVAKYFSNDKMLMPQLLTEVFDIPINFYIIKKSNREPDIDSSVLNEQISILNNAFAYINIRFSIRKIVYKVHKNWYLAFSSKKIKDRKYNNYYNHMIKNIDFNKSQLNVIINGCELLGQASFPFDNTYKTKKDNIIIVKKTLPGLNDSFTGDTLVHEMGHFFGLYHTFHNTINCTCKDENNNFCVAGDLVSDTPPQNYCCFDGCDTTIKSCDGITTIDVKNFMGYNPDNCMDHFTEGQYIRMEKFLYDKRLYLVEQNLFNL